MVIYNKGGRGNKNPYKSVVVRVPEPLVYRIDAMIEAYKQAVKQGSYEGIENAHLLCENPLDTGVINRDEAIEKAKAILRGRKNAKLSLLKLLQVLVDDGIVQDDLEK